MEGVVNSAVHSATAKQIDFQNLSKIKDRDLQKIRVTGKDFDKALEDVPPTYGQASVDYSALMSYGICMYSTEFSETLKRCEQYIRNISQQDIQMMSLLLEGAPKSGKSALAAHLAKTSDFAFVRFVSPQLLPGSTEYEKIRSITEIFDDAYKSDTSCIVLDDFDQLCEYVPIGPRFSNVVLQTLRALVQKPPKKGRKLLIIGTSSSPDFMVDSLAYQKFTCSVKIPNLEKSSSMMKLMQHLHQPDGFAREVISLLSDKFSIPVAKVISAVELAPASKSTAEIFVTTLS